MAQLGEAIVPGGRDRLKHLLLDAARVVMPLGAAAVISTVGTSHGANAALAFLGLLLLLLGVCLLSFVQVAGRFRQADRLAGAAIAKANAVLRHLFTPWN